MNKIASTHENLFCYGQIRSLHAQETPVLREKLQIKEFVRHDFLPALRNALLSDKATFTTTPNTQLQISLSPLSLQCLWELHSGIMLRLLENITGAKNLLPDTHCKRSRLLLPGNASATHPIQPDPDTGLQPALVMFISLEQGNADLYLPTAPADSMDVGSGVLQMVYWIHQAGNP